MTIFIDGDFPSGKGTCRFHCSPTCHPLQTDKNEWKYGCTHPAWPANKYGDFVPIVRCGGNIKKCELKGKKFTSYYLRGRKISLTWAKRKIERLEKEIKETEELL